MDQVIDPVCGMSIDPKSAAGMRVQQEHTVYFCSAECMQKFELDPARYGPHGSPEVQGDSAVLEQHEPPYTTSGSVTAPKFGSAGSGGLEYERLPEAHEDDREGSR